MSIAKRYRHAWSPSEPSTSSRKKSGKIRLPMNRPCRSVNWQRTVSIWPVCASSASSSTDSMPCVCIDPPVQMRGARPRSGRAHTQNLCLDGLQLLLDGRELLGRPLHDRSGEPLACRQHVPQADHDEQTADDDRGEVEDIDELHRRGRWIAVQVAPV